MTRFAITIAASIVALVGLLFALGAAPPLGWTTVAHIERVVDGDTLDVVVERRLRIRLLNCWAPESETRNLAEKEKGIASKAALQELALGRPCLLHVPTAGMRRLDDVMTFSRVLGSVWLVGDDKSLAELQIDSGHAWRTKSELQEQPFMDQ